MQINVRNEQRIEVNGYQVFEVGAFLYLGALWTKKRNSEISMETKFSCSKRLYSRIDVLR